ncbi:MAG: DUF5677 domain-containing protein, partial [Planctomycetota bacterium]|nr:DUF5677 domain-containing protein [Planctomycetota bacterium]
LGTYNPDFDITELHAQECANHKINSKNPKSNSWSGLSTKDMSEEIGLLDLYYKKVYWIYSQIAHPHPGGSSSYMKYDSNGNIVTHDEPNTRNCQMLWMNFCIS